MWHSCRQLIALVLINLQRSASAIFVRSSIKMANLFLQKDISLTGRMNSFVPSSWFGTIGVVVGVDGVVIVKFSPKS